MCVPSKPISTADKTRVLGIPEAKPSLGGVVSHPEHRPVEDGMLLVLRPVCEYGDMNALNF